MGIDAACVETAATDGFTVVSCSWVEGNPSTSGNVIDVSFGESERGTVDDFVSIPELTPEPAASLEVKSTSIGSRPGSECDFKFDCDSGTRKDCLDGERLNVNRDLFGASQTI